MAYVVNCVLILFSALGRANSQRVHTNPLAAHPVTGTRREPLGGSSTRSNVGPGPSLAASSTQGMSGGDASSNAIRREVPESGSPWPGYDTRGIAREITMVRPESQPRRIDVDSTSDITPTAQSGQAPLELASPEPIARPSAPRVSSSSSQGQGQGSLVSRYHSDARLKLSAMAKSHPSPLVPGLPGTQTRFQSPVEENSPLPPPQDDSRQEQQQQPQQPELRPNLDLTQDERKNNQHIASWDKY